MPGSEGSVPSTFLPPTPSDVLLVKMLCSRAMGLQRAQLGARLRDAGGQRLAPGAGSSALSLVANLLLLVLPTGEGGLRPQQGGSVTGWRSSTSPGGSLWPQEWSWGRRRGGWGTRGALAQVMLQLSAVSQVWRSPCSSSAPPPRVLPGSGHPSHSAVGRSRSPAEICSASSPARPFL